jgi:hypothetical protein
MDGKEILKEFELEKEYDPITTSDCELTNWLIKKLIEARQEIGKLHLDAIRCSYEFYLFEGNQIMVDRDVKKRQNQGWELAGEISVKFSKHGMDRMLIPLKRRL